MCVGGGGHNTSFFKILAQNAIISNVCSNRINGSKRRNRRKICMKLQRTQLNNKFYLTNSIVRLYCGFDKPQ